MEAPDTRGIKTPQAGHRYSTHIALPPDITGIQTFRARFHFLSASRMDANR